METRSSKKAKQQVSSKKSLQKRSNKDLGACKIMVIPSTSKKAKQVRNWVELPPDVLSLIFIKLGVIDILLGAQSVCSVWRKLSKEPHLYRSIDMRGCRDLRGKYDMQKMAIEAVNRSSGQLVEFSIEHFATDAVLRSIMQKCSLLRCFRLATCNLVSEKVMIEMAKKFPQLEELEICHCSFSTAVIEAFGSSCRHLKSFRLNRKGFKGPPSPECDKEALVIAKNMPELRHLNIFGNRVTDNGLRAILDGCPHLCSLDLRQCFNVHSLTFRHRLVEANKDLRKRCLEGNILSKLPNDDTSGYEFDPFFETAMRWDEEEEVYHLYNDEASSDDDSCVIM